MNFQSKHCIYFFLLNLVTSLYDVMQNHWFFLLGVKIKLGYKNWNKYA